MTLCCDLAVGCGGVNVRMNLSDCYDQICGVLKIVLMFYYFMTNMVISAAFLTALVMSVQPGRL